MHVCVCVCIYIYIHVYGCIYVCVRECMYVCVSVYSSGKGQDWKVALGSPTADPTPSLKYPAPPLCPHLTLVSVILHILGDVNRAPRLHC